MSRGRHRPEVNYLASIGAGLAAGFCIFVTGTFLFLLLAPIWQ